MKKIYNAPEAGLLCFRPVEGLAASELDFVTMLQLSGGQSGEGKAADTSETDIKINV